MRKLTLGLATSLDNYIARTDDGTDWLRWNQIDLTFLPAKRLKNGDLVVSYRSDTERL